MITYLLYIFHPIITKVGAQRFIKPNHQSAHSITKQDNLLDNDLVLISIKKPTSLTDQGAPQRTHSTPCDQ